MIPLNLFKKHICHTHFCFKTHQNCICQFIYCFIYQITNLISINFDETHLHNHLLLVLLVLLVLVEIGFFLEDCFKNAWNNATVVFFSFSLHGVSLSGSLFFFVFRYYLFSKNRSESWATVRFNTMKKKKLANVCFTCSTQIALKIVHLQFL